MGWEWGYAYSFARVGRWGFAYVLFTLRAGVSVYTLRISQMHAALSRDKEVAREL